MLNFAKLRDSYMYGMLYPKHANQSCENYMEGKIANPSGKISRDRNVVLRYD